MPPTKPPLTLPEIEQRIQQVYDLLDQINQELRAAYTPDRQSELLKAKQDLDHLLVKLLAAQLKAKEGEHKPEHPKQIEPSTGNDRLALLKDADAGSTKRSEYVASRLVSLQGSNILIYQSATYLQHWIQTIQLNLRKNMTMYGIKQAIDGPLYVHCDCPAFKWWGYQYICTSRQIVIPGKENSIFPHIRNPHLVGTVCKHIIHVLEQLPQDAKAIYRLLNAGQPWVA